MNHIYEETLLPDGRSIGIILLTYGRARIVTWRETITLEDGW